MNPFQIRKITNEAERKQAFSLRYRVYVEEHGVSEAGADHGRRLIEDPLDPAAGSAPVDSGVLLGAFMGERLVGTARINASAHPDIGRYALWHRFATFELRDEHRAAVVSRLCIDPEYRMSTALHDLTSGLYEQMLGHGVKICFLDCGAALEPVFRRYGFRQVFRSFNHPEYGEVNSMVLVTHDRAYLKSVQSPLLDGTVWANPNCESVSHFERVMASAAEWQSSLKRAA